MTAQEIKSEIHKSLDKVPESILQDILSLLKQAESQSPGKINLAAKLRTILREDKELLERLAQ